MCVIRIGSNRHIELNERQPYGMAHTLSAYLDYTISNVNAKLETVKSASWQCRGKKLRTNNKQDEFVRTIDYKCGSCIAIAGRLWPMTVIRVWPAICTHLLFNIFVINDQRFVKHLYSYYDLCANNSYDVSMALYWHYRQAWNSETLIFGFKWQI